MVRETKHSRNRAAVGTKFELVTGYEVEGSFYELQLALQSCRPVKWREAARENLTHRTRLRQSRKSVLGPMPQDMNPVELGLPW
jgi:hypothetical protein